MPQVNPRASYQGVVTNPLLVTTSSEELVWERAVDVLHEFHFELEKENRLGRIIETKPLVGAGVLEPWHRDAVTLADRWEGSLQSIRRKAQVSLQLDDQGRGYLVSVAVFKELEDVPGIAANSPGAATFSESTPLQRDLDPVVGQSTPSIWIPQGRDTALEQSMLQRMKVVYAR
ncbi:MAG: hypothetical protein KDA80_05045 [Planctomycetaceae bacterium]|nr:hypothetical protein [Planctomycetaceae bacterium]